MANSHGKGHHVTNGPQHAVPRPKTMPGAYQAAGRPPPPMPNAPSTMAPPAQPHVQRPVVPQMRPQAPAPAAPQPSPAMARPAAPMPAADADNGSNRRFSDRFKGAASDGPVFSSAAGDSGNSKMLVIAFLIFFVFMSALAVYRVNKSEAALSQSVAMQTADADGKAVSERIGMAVRWIDTAIALRGTAGQTVTNVARGPGVTQVAMLDASGKIIASKNGNGSAFRTVSLKNFPKSGIRLTAVISDAGVANPVIARSVGDAFVLTMLAPGSLIGVDNMQGRTALVDRGRNVLDGSGTIARDGIADAYALPGNKIDDLMAAGGTAVGSASGLRVTAARVANTDLKLFNAPPGEAINLPDNKLTFIVLFFATAFILLALLRNVLGHFAKLRETQREAEVSKERFRVAVESGRGGVWEIDLKNNAVYLSSSLAHVLVWDKLGRLVLWNGKFEDFFGFKPGQLQTGIENHVVEHHGNEAIEEVYDSEDAEGQIEIKLKDGRWVRYSEAPTADGGQVSIGTDITEIRARENDLRENDIALRNTVDVLKKSQTRIMELAENYEQEKIRAEDANQSKSDFLANMSHELRTPLNAINGFSDIMKKEMFGPLGDPRYKEYVSDILFSGQHLLSLINDIF